MKQPKKLTRNQKEILVKKGMNPDDYMLHSEDEKDDPLQQEGKETGSSREVSRRCMTI